AQEGGIGPPCLAAAPPRARPADPFWSPLAVVLPQRPEERPDLLPLTQDVWTLGLGAASPAFGARLGLSLAPVQLADPRGGKRLALAIAPAGAPAALTHQLIHSLGAPPLPHRPGR
ncbi:MAG: hypothetical protein IE922_14615, partial [Sphingomonadales bacterium]|nr:hypothetical protein [Sphingomonadales bacterium]